MARTAAFAATLAQPNTVLLASASALSTGSTGIVDGHSTNTGRIYQTGTQLAAHAGAGLLTASTTITNWHTTAARFNGASSSIRLDGVEHSAGNAGAASTAGLTVGAHGGLAGFWPGDIGEIVAANADLDATGELEDAENYLMQRWT